jgi:hypothetical protein
MGVGDRVGTLVGGVEDPADLLGKFLIGDEKSDLLTAVLPAQRCLDLPSPGVEKCLVFRLLRGRGLAVFCVELGQPPVSGLAVVI